MESWPPETHWREARGTHVIGDVARAALGEPVTIIVSGGGRLQQ